MSALSTIRDTLTRHQYGGSMLGMLGTVPGRSPALHVCSCRQVVGDSVTGLAQHQASHVLADLAREDVIAAAGGIDLEEMIRLTKVTGLREAAGAMPARFDDAAAWVHWYADSVETEAEAGEQP